MTKGIFNVFCCLLAKVSDLDVFRRLRTLHLQSLCVVLEDQPVMRVDWNVRGGLTKVGEEVVGGA